LKLQAQVNYFVFKKQANNYEGKFVILQSVGIILIKSKEKTKQKKQSNKGGAYSCRCSSRQLIPTVLWHKTPAALYHFVPFLITMCLAQNFVIDNLHFI